MKLLGVAQRLNGWQRIWIVLTVLWTLGLSFVTLAGWPVAEGGVGDESKPESTEQLAIIRRMIDAGETVENIATIVNHFTDQDAAQKPSGFDPTKPYQVIVPSGFDPNKPYQPVHASGYDPNKPSQPVYADPQAQATASFADDLAKVRADRAKARAQIRAEDLAKQEEALRKALQHRRVSFVAKLTGVWSLPLIALYALGWSVGWIRRGFAR